MLIYYIYFITLTIFSFFEINFKKLVEYRIVYVIVAILLILMAGLRYKTGFDFENYEIIFDLAASLNPAELLIEPGSYLIIKILQALHFGFQSYLFLYAALAVIIKVRFFGQYAPYIFVAVLVYFPIGFLQNEMGQIRHGLAIAFVLIAFAYLFENKNKWFLFYSVLAIFFHISAFIVLPVYFFVNRNFKSSYLVLSASLLSVLVFFDSRPLYLLLLNYVPIPIIINKATLYLYSDEFGLPLGFNFSFVLRMLFFFLLIIYRERGNQKFKFYDKMIWLYYYGILLYIVFNSIAAFAIRTSIYFKTLDSLILACIIALGKGRKEKNIILLLTVSYAYFSLNKLLKDPALGIYFIPYRSVLSKYF